MQELLLYLAKSLVDQPDQVKVTQTEGPEAVILELLGLAGGYQF